MSAENVADVPAENRHVIQIEDLHVTFPGRRGGVAKAVDGVNLSIDRGEIVALVGESGCGKTTLARIDSRTRASGVRKGAVQRRTVELLQPSPEAISQERSARAAGPDRCAEPATRGLRSGGRGTSYPPNGQRAGPGHSRAQSGWPSATGALLLAVSPRTFRRAASARRYRRRA